MTGDDDSNGHEGDGRDDEMRSAPRIPGPRAAADDFDLDAFPLPPPVPATEPEEPRPAPQPTTPEPESAAAPPAPSGPPAAPALVLPHRVLKALLGAWALAACSAEEAEAVEAHLTVCAACADEALRLRDAVGLLQTDRRSGAAFPGDRRLPEPPSGQHPGAALGRPVRRGDRAARRAVA